MELPLLLGSYILFLNVVHVLNQDRQDLLHLFGKTLLVPLYMCECIFLHRCCAYSKAENLFS